jgi:hypothetical protein
LFDTTLRSVADPARIARMSTIGTPTRPKPPTASDAPLVMSATAATADG